MSVVHKSFLLLAAGTLTVPLAAASVPGPVSFQGQPAFQLSAADVFRMRAKAKGLSKTLRPLFGETYYNEAGFRQALEEKLNAKLMQSLYPDLKKAALIPAKNLAVTMLSDDTARIRYYAQGSGSQAESELLDLSRFTGPSKLKTGPDWLNTGEMKLSIDKQTLCVTLNDSEHKLTQVCPSTKGKFTLEPYAKYYLSGLGQEFQQPGVTNPYWNDRVRHSGNQMEGFDGGATGNTQFPILYASNPKGGDFSLYLDNVYSAEWDFSARPWQIKAANGEVNLILSVAQEQSELRKNYLAMTGAPLVPPRKMFGMWLSEYGFDNWQEMDDKLVTLKKKQFPIDGVVMDLQWFGNVFANDPQSPMGSLTWDEENFPEPEKKIAQLKQSGIGMVLIEESYVSEGLPEYAEMEADGYLARDPKTGKALNTKADGGGQWWGRGGMIDWINPKASTKWHDWKREPLIEMGILGHWTDLGEPEMYNSKAVYGDGQPHADIHNLYNYKWLESIFDGYQRHGHTQRPFMMSRSGAPGIQRFGASMWSADIGSDLDSLAVHIGMQTNMSLSGIDYYGSDIGGFHRGALKQRDKLDQTYTRWFAYSSLFDVPVRPHTENLCNCKETAPDRIGDEKSNLANIRLRYQLIPYQYSLAHLAYWHQEPVFPALSYHYPQDEQAWKHSNHRMMGDALMSVGVAKLDIKTTDVYLPAGGWFDFHTGEYHTSKGELLSQYPLVRDGVYQLPLFAREGAIVPLNPNPQLGSDVPDTLGVKVFGAADGEFTLFEDDGKTLAYRDGRVSMTLLKADKGENTLSLSLATQGQYPEMKTVRTLALEWYLSGQQVKSVTLDGTELKGWLQKGNKLEFTLSELNLSRRHNIVIALDQQG